MKAVLYVVKFREFALQYGSPATGDQSEDEKAHGRGACYKNVT